MAKTSFAGPASATALVHARTSGGSEKSEVFVLGTDGTDAVLDPATLATSAKQDAILAAVAHGTFAYAAGTAAATVDVPAGGRARFVTVLAGAGPATIVIAGGATITVPAGGSLDIPIVGDTAAGADVVIGGTVASYLVTWTV